MATCIHGFPSGECLICSTLQSAPGNQKREAAAAPSRQAPAPASTPAPSPGRSAPAAARPRSAPASPAVVVRPAAPFTPAGRDGSPAPSTHQAPAGKPAADRPARRGAGRTMVEVLVVLGLIALAVIVAGLSTNIIRGLIHILEVAVVGVAAGVIGYGVGRVHGRIRRKEQASGR